MRSPRFVLAALALFAPLAVHAPLQAQAGGAAAARARVVVKFKADSPVLARERAQALSASGRSASRAAALGERVGVPLSGGALASERVQVMHARGISSAELARRLATQSDVEYAEPDVRHRRTAPPNDPRYASGLGGNGPAVGQWYLRAPAGAVVSSIDVEPAWDVTAGSTSVVVAVLDTGVRFDHDDMLRVANGGKLLPGYDMVDEDDTNVFLSANDGNGRDADPSDPGDWVSSADIANSDGLFDGCDVESSSWHGTQTASLVGALTDNGLGMASVGRNVRVLPVRVLGKCGGYTADIAAGIRWAAGIAVPGVPANPNPAKVINLSLGGEGACSSVYRDAVNEAVAAGAVIVVSAGNSSGHAVSQPANCSSVIAVTGLRHVGTKVGFADVGPEVALAAPGGNCVNTGANDPCLYPIITATNAGTTTPLAGSSVYTDAFNIAVGTSFSAPLVAGTAGLMFSARPELAVADVRALLQGTSRTFPTTGGSAGISACHAPNSSDQAECYCTTTTCGAGMLDAGAAVAAADRGLLARISLGNNAPRAEVELTLSAATSYVITGRTLATYQWALVDGGGIVSAIANASGPTATVTPTGSGRFTVQLTVTDSSGAQSTSNRSVDVLPVVSNPPLITGDGGGGGGGALGLAWLAGLAAAVLALQWQRKRRLRAKPVR